MLRGLAGAALFFVAAPALAQNTSDSMAFDFSLPGARSRGIGGAFVAVADDATSVYSNPAGLTQLFRPEISIEGRHWDFTDVIPSSGHEFGPATGTGVDTVNGIVDGRFTSDKTGLSFLSLVIPGNRWAFGVFRHQLSRYTTARKTEGPFFDCQGGYRGENPTAPFCEPQAMADGIDRDGPTIQRFDLDIHSTGAAFAFDWTKRVSVGLALQYFHFDLDALNTVFSVRGRKYEPADYSDPGNVDVTGAQRGTDHGWAANLGILWRVSEQWTAAASFRQGPTFHFLAQTTTGSANPGGPGNVFVNEPDNPFKVPDTAAVGFAYRPSTPWRIGFEYDLVKFGQLSENFRQVAVPAEDPEGATILQHVAINDAHQLRFGGEYAFVVFGSTLVAVRGGTWYDPSHQIFFRADDPSTGLPAPRWAMVFPERGGVMHWSAGIGIATYRHLQVDAAVDRSDLVSTIALSAIWRF